VADESEPRQRRPARRPPADRDDGQVRSAARAARIAVQEIAALTGRTPDNVVAVKRRDEGWCVSVEVVETHRIPDSADILAIYEIELDRHGELVAYRRTERYLRGRVEGR
jgi:hypothetical protein